MNKIKNMIAPYFNLPKEAYVIFISRIINAMGAMVGTVMSFILKDKIGFTEHEVGIIITLASFVLIIPPIFGGKLADMIGRKKTILIFDTLGLISYFICGFLKPSMVLVFFMLLAAVFYSTAGPAHESLLADISDEKNRKQVFALSYIGWNLGFSVGAVLAGLLYSSFLWLIFIGDALTTLLSISLIIVFIKNVAHHEKINDNKLENAEIGSIIDVLLRRPKLIIFSLIIMGFNFIYSQWGYLLQMNLLSLYGEKNGPKYYGYMASLNGIIVIALTMILSILFLKTKNYKLIVAGGLFYTVGFGLLGFYQELIYFFLCITIFTIGEILLTISVSPYIFNHTPSSHRGRMSGVLGFIMSIGWILGPMISGTILRYTSYYTTWKIIGFVALSYSIFMYLLGLFDKPIVKEENILQQN